MKVRSPKEEVLNYGPVETKIILYFFSTRTTNDLLQTCKNYNNYD